LYTEYSANFDLLHALLQMRGYGSFRVIVNSP